MQDCQDEPWAIILRQTENIVMPGEANPDARIKIIALPIDASA